MDDEELDRLETFIQAYLNQLENAITSIECFLKITIFEDEDLYGTDKTRKFIEERLKILKDTKQSIDKCQDRKSLKRYLKLKKMLKDVMEGAHPYE